MWLLAAAQFGMGGRPGAASVMPRTGLAPGGVMTREEMLSIDNAVKDAIGAGDLDAFDRLMAPELAADFKEAIAELRRAFPDYGGTNEVQIVEGDRSATRWVYYGTHEGEYAGVSPTGRRVKFTGIAMNRYADGKIVESVVEGDLLSVLQQIGATSVPDEGD
jgi:predicted ester cyclase